MLSLWQTKPLLPELTLLTMPNIRQIFQAFLMKFAARKKDLISQGWSNSSHTIRECSFQLEENYEVNTYIWLSCWKERCEHCECFSYWLGNSFVYAQINSWGVCWSLKRWCMDSRVPGINLTIHVISPIFSAAVCGWQDVFQKMVVLIYQHRRSCAFFSPSHSGCVILYIFFCCLWS